MAVFFLPYYNPYIYVEASRTTKAQPSMTDLIFGEQDAVKAIRQTDERGQEWLYKNYPKPNGKTRKSITGFLMYEGKSYPVKPLGRLANEIAGSPMTENPITNVFRRHFENLGFQLINSPEDEAENAVERQRRLANILARPEQAKFRQAVFKLFGARCLVTECETLDALEAAHVLSVSDDGSDKSWNGVPLRADLHRLFDADLISIDPSTWTLSVTKSAHKDYHQYHGRDLGDKIAQTGKGPELAKAFQQRKAQKK